MVSAWRAANRLVLAQQATEAKSNEITAIPKVLEVLELKGCIVTVDAMGCQKTIADTRETVDPGMGGSTWQDKKAGLGSENLSRY